MAITLGDVSEGSEASEIINELIVVVVMVVVLVAVLVVILIVVIIAMIMINKHQFNKPQHKGSRQ